MGKCWWLIYGLLGKYVAHIELCVLSIGTVFTETDSIGARVHYYLIFAEGLYFQFRGIQL